MKTKVFMAKTGELVLAHPVCFLGESVNMPDHEYYICMGTHDGYIIESPQATKLNYYMSRKCEEFFEDLGEF